MPDYLDFALRGGAATTFMVLAVILLRDGGNRTLARLGALFAVSTGWWALNTQPFASWSYQWAFPLVVLSYGKTAAFWLFTRALFEDGFRMNRLDWAIWGGMVALGGVWVFRARLGLPTNLFQMPHQLAQIALASAAIWVAWKGRRNDLIETRRRARSVFVLLSALFMIGITTSYLAPGRPPAFVTDLNVARMFVMAIGLALLVSGLQSQEMFGAPGLTSEREDGKSVICADPAEARLLNRLRFLMEEDRVYRMEGLTIGSLASRIGAPEYTLRRLINQRLGYRNFSAYLNGYRLADVRAALVDPTQRAVPISTIALDAGFRSLGPFNRAFKVAEGMTPTEFRDASGHFPNSLTKSPIMKIA